eukprot:13903876-Heterocapsa_arctica.AAC.1
MTPVWRDNAPLIDQLVEWERTIRNYESASGKRVGDDRKCAILTSRAPSHVCGFLRLSPIDTTGDYGHLRAAIRGYLS